MYNDEEEQIEEIISYQNIINRLENKYNIWYYLSQVDKNFIKNIINDFKSNKEEIDSLIESKDNEIVSKTEEIEELEERNREILEENEVKENELKDLRKKYNIKKKVRRIKSKIAI